MKQDVQACRVEIFRARRVLIVFGTLLRNVFDRNPIPVESQRQLPFNLELCWLDSQRLWYSHDVPQH